MDGLEQLKRSVFAGDWNSFSTALVEPDFQNCEVGCVASALEDIKYRPKLADAGFEQIEIEPTRVYSAQDARDILAPRELTPTPSRRKSMANS